LVESLNRDRILIDFILLIYLVDAPLDVFWKFKTDFDNQFLLSNKLIISHRFVSRNRNVVVTEFDFFGVSIWVSYPFYGGMSYFLKYTTGWEQQTILKLKNKYEE